MKHLGKLIFVLFLLAGCEDTFDSPPQSLVGVAISTIDTTSTAGTDTLLLTVYGVGQDSLLEDSSEVTKVSLPLTTANQSSFIFTFNSITDTLTIHHENTLMAEDAESGFYYEYRITGVDYTKNRIDSVSIPDSTVTTTWNENIQIYISALPDSTVTDQ